MADRNFTVNMIIGARDRASRVMRRLRDSLGRLNNRVVQVGGLLATYFGARAIGSLFSGAIGSARSFEEQLDRIAAVTGATGEQMEQLRGIAERMGATTKFTSTQAAEGLEILGRAGQTVEEQLTTLPVVLQLAEAAGLDLNTAAGIITDSLGAMGQEVSEAGRFADVLAQGAKLANTDVTGLGRALSYAGVQAAQMGLTAEDTVGVLDALANSGIRGERAGTALRNILSQLQDPASKARQELRKLGVDTDNLIEVIGGLEDAGPAAQAAILAFGTEAGPAVRTLLQEGVEGLQAYIQSLNQAEGAAGRMADVATSNLQGAIDGLAAAWDALRRTVVDPLLEPIRTEAENLAETMRNLVQDGSLDALRQGLVDLFAGGVAAIRRWITQAGGVRPVLERLGNAFQGAGRLIQNFVGSIDGAARGIRTVWNVATGFIKAIGTGVTWIVQDIMGGIADVAEGLASIGLVSDETAKKLRTMAGGTRAAFDAMAEALREDGRDIKEAMTGVGQSADTAREKTDRLKDSVKGAGDAAQEAAQKIKVLEPGYFRIERSSKRAEWATYDLQEAIKGHTGTLSTYSSEAATASASTEQIKEQFQGLVGAISEANTEQALGGLRRGLRQMFVEGKISAEQLDEAMAQVRQRMDEVRETAGETIDSMGDFNTALGTAETIDDLEQLQSSLKEAWEAGRISAEQYNEALEQTQEKQKRIEETAGPAAKKMQETVSIGQAGLDIFKRAAKFQQELSDMQKESVSEAAALRQEYDKTEARLMEVTQWLRDNPFKPWKVFTAMEAFAKRAEYRLLEYRRSVLKAQITVNDWEERLEESNRDASLLAVNAEVAAQKIAVLGQERVDELTQSIRQAQQEMLALRDSAEQTLESVQADLLSARGDLEELERLRFEQRREQIQQQLTQATERGDQVAAADLREALDKLADLEDIRIKEVRQQRQEEKRREKDQAERDRTEERRTRPDPAVERHELHLKFDSGREVELEGAGDQVRTMIDELRRSSLRTS